MKSSFGMILALLSPLERKRGAIVFFILLLVAIAQMMGVASIMPFLAVLSDPGVIQTNKALKFLYEFFGFETDQSFMVFLGLSFFTVLSVSLVLNAVGLWARLRFSQNREYVWGARLVNLYLRQPYEWFLNKHSSEMATSVLSEVGQVVRGALLPAMELIAYSLLAFFMLVLLIVVDPVLAVSIGTLLGGSYTLISLLLKKRLTRIGEERRVANHRRFLVVNEAFVGIKQVKISGLERSLINRFEVPAQTLAKHQISSGLMAQLPNSAMQGVLAGVMLLVLSYSMFRYGSFQNALPVIAVYAFAGYRLMPALQQVYQSATQLRFSRPPLEALHNDFSSMSAICDDEHADVKESAGKIPLDSCIELRDICYSYPNSSKRAINSLSLKISAKTKVAFVGSTGSGKTTTVDLILGLLRPAFGAILVDGAPLNERTVRLWQRSLGYVPQEIFLIDDSIAANIAFGLSPEKIDFDSVLKASKAANLHEFVSGELEAGYDTKIGEQGVRLSGGQRQRIGIARALYHDPDVLILDEATSALDNLTERAVMEAVNNLGNKKTIIVIAHRLSTVRDCDVVFLLEGGRLVESGSYDQLLEKSGKFREMAVNA